MLVQGQAFGWREDSLEFGWREDSLEWSGYQYNFDQQIKSELQKANQAKQEKEPYENNESKNRFMA